MAESGYPVSIKGVLVRNDRVLLVHNERDEWELPGGRIEPGETPEQTVAREITEETGPAVDVAEILDAWGRRVRRARSARAADAGGYKRSIATWFDRLRASVTAR